MSPWNVTITIFGMFASLALGDDFKTTTGKEYKGATVSRVEPDGLVLITKTGISKVYFVELPKEIQQRFHYDGAQAAQFTQASQAAEQSFNAQVVRREEEAQHAQEQQRQAVERQARLDAEQLKKVEAERQRQFVIRADIQRQQLAAWQAAQAEKYRDDQIRSLQTQVNAARIEAARARQEAQSANSGIPEADRPHH